MSTSGNNQTDHLTHLAQIAAGFAGQPVPSVHALKSLLKPSDTPIDSQTLSDVRDGSTQTITSLRDASVQTGGSTGQGTGTDVPVAPHHSPDAEGFLERVKATVGEDNYRQFIDIMSDIRVNFVNHRKDLVMEKLDTVKAMLTHESPTLRMELDDYFPVLHAFKSRHELEQQTFERSRLQFQLWNHNQMTRQQRHDSNLSTTERSSSGENARVGAEWWIRALGRVNNDQWTANSRPFNPYVHPVPFPAYQSQLQQYHQHLHQLQQQIHHVPYYSPYSYGQSALPMSSATDTTRRHKSRSRASKRSPADICSPVPEEQASSAVSARVDKRAKTTQSTSITSVDSQKNSIRTNPVSNVNALDRSFSSSPQQMVAVENTGTSMHFQHIESPGSSVVDDIQRRSDTPPSVGIGGLSSDYNSSGYSVAVSKPVHTHNEMPASPTDSSTLSLLTLPSTWTDDIETRLQSGERSTYSPHRQHGDMYANTSDFRTV
mmetsp:Transcript_15939/g.24015  ORF Transcript_15939/g.24015 Transcript_15939/m.24015 type:complete len:488 (+) Transcript_15939:46-1509(+)